MTILDAQTTLPIQSCKAKGCPRPVVGHSTTGEGYVCKGHNELEWGRALKKYDPSLSTALIVDSERSLSRSA